MLAYHFGGGGVGLTCYVTDGHVAIKYFLNVTRNRKQNCGDKRDEEHVSHENMTW